MFLSTMIGIMYLLSRRHRNKTWLSVPFEAGDPDFSWKFINLSSSLLGEAASGVGLHTDAYSEKFEYSWSRLCLFLDFFLNFFKFLEKFPHLMVCTQLSTESC